MFSGVVSAGMIGRGITNAVLRRLCRWESSRIPACNDGCMSSRARAVPQFGLNWYRCIVNNREPAKPLRCNGLPRLTCYHNRIECLLPQDFEPIVWFVVRCTSTPGQACVGDRLVIRHVDVSNGAW